MKRSAMPRLLCALTVGLCLLGLESARAADWDAGLKQEIERIDRESPGKLGVYVKRLKQGDSFNYGADQRWYLGSTVKVPIAIAVLQQVDAGQLKLSDTMTLEPGDRIEAGQLVWRKPGAVISIDELLQRMLGDSDNTAANMLIRKVGLAQVNRSAQAAMGADGLGTLSTLAEVRYDVYAELHPDARKLSNDQLVTIASAPMGPQRVEALRQALDVPASAFQVKTIDEAYDRYYRRGLNAATLVAYGAMLEKLVQGKLLQPASMQKLFTAMKIDIFTNYRLQAGLPRRVKFIHKTGTQHRTACHAGVIQPQNGGADAIVVATCASGLDEQREAGKVFERVGRAITKTVLD
ncbi:serine hydrolase [Variovorax sp. J2P1-31]|uniref:serine hydrolase n=2 Tax=unclassified Variovorax TaxID=663243 RepID=UPI0025776EC3|nr:serine hydrolase [Variovorax sp. J2P1-31]MDM0086975.1 serine hydrolase [Variovorax sp. J22G40]MDM0144768.1 serine hydrolase [Variovorax sp. J2P1-31]